MAEVVTVDVVVRDRGAKTTLRDVAGESKKTGTAFGEMGKDAKSLSKQLFDMDIQLRKTAMELERTGDTSLVKGIRKQQREIAALVKVRKDVLGISFGGKDDGGAASSAAKAGAGFGMSFVDAASNAMSRGGTKFVAAVTGAIAIASPFIGASLAAAVLGASGTLGIAGGVAMAAQDPRVKSAAAGLGATFMAEFGRATDSFIGPTIGALEHFELAAIDVAGKLAPSFDGLSDHVVPLAQALTTMVTNTLPGFTKGLTTAEHVLSALENVLPEFGEDLSAMFEDMAENPEAAAAAMHNLVTVVGETARGIGFLTKFLSSYYEVLIKVGHATTGWANDLPMVVKQITPLAAVADFFDQTDTAIKKAMEDAPHFETKLREIGEAATDTAEELRGLKDAIDDAFSPVMDLDQATLRYQKGLIELQKELKEGKRTLAINSEEGIRNRDAILDQIQAIKDLRDATATVPEKVDAANAAYEAQLEALRKNLLSLGFNKEAVNALIDAYKNIPASVTTEFRYPGLLEAIAKFRELARLTGSNAAAARALGPGEGTFNQGGDTSGYGGGRASGGYMAPGMSYDVAESGTGVERVKMLQGGGAIVQNMDQWSKAGGGGGGGGWSGGAQHVIWEVRSGGSEMDDMITQIIRRTVTVVGGGNVQKTYGRDDR